MNTMNQQFVSTETLEQQLRQKLSEYQAAEANGDRNQLNAIYKEIKNIRYQITTLQYPVNTPSRENTSYR